MHRTVIGGYAASPNERTKSMRNLISTFFQDDDGAVTVDFVVLTAAICLLGFVVVTAFSGSAVDLANGISVAMDNMQTE